LEGLDWVEASLKTIRGTIVSRWEKKNGSLLLEVAIPVNSWGEVHVPTLGLKRLVVEEGGRVVWRDGHFIEGFLGVESGRLEGNYVVFRVGSGSYRFLVKEEAT
jgi:alpha-L-rhamnosidase